ncbi:MAG: protein kinase [Bryobacteraceae bacterium]
MKPGERLGPYEILALLGTGGMGEVYRARDTRLGRDVAIKVSHEHFSERFDREARAVAALNHSNICTLYDVGPNYLVMECIEGESPKGPMPLDDALRIAQQIADALEAAHEKGIVHRDLKPANIKIKPDGTVKVLDFGLAKMPEPAPGGNPENSPTLSMRVTQGGAILGTAAYMSPEQARGNPVDKRTDIWAFGVVLYELLTGQRPFSGDSISDVLAGVLKSEPDWTTVPAQAQRLLHACLEKEPKKRLQAIGDYGLTLQDLQPVAGARFRPLPWIIAVALLMVVAAIGWLRPRPAPVSTPHLALSIKVSGLTFLPGLSPDGGAVLYVIAGKAYLRRLDSLQAQEVTGYPGGFLSWSPDSRSIALAANRELQTMRLPDGAPASMGPLPIITRGGSWSDKGTILVASIMIDKEDRGLYAAPATGGELKHLEVAGFKTGQYYLPEFLPGGEDFLFTFVPAASEGAEIYLARLKDAKVADPVLLFKNDTAVRYTPAGGGRILFVRNDNLYAQRLDLKARKLAGDAELVAERVASSPMSFLAHFSVSNDGKVAWQPGKAELSEIAIFTRQGRRIGTAGSPSPIRDIRLSPDETRLLGDSETGAWLFERDQQGRLNLGREFNWLAWSPDGSEVLGMDGGRRVMELPVNGSAKARQVALGDDSIVTVDISSDGKVLLLSNTSSITSIRLEGSAEERRPKLLVRTDERVRYAKFSPDARWIVYRTQTGIYVQTFPGLGLRKQIASTSNAFSPVWRGDGKEILYYDDHHIWSVRVDRAGEDLHFSAPKVLFQVGVPFNLIPASTALAVSRDGSRIYFLQPVEQPDAGVINVQMGLWK